MTSPDRVDANATDTLTLDLLAWLGSSSRTYAEAMAAWRTSCPKLSIWEDALADDLIRIVPEAGKPIAQAEITLTARGRAALDSTSEENDATSIVES